MPSMTRALFWKEWREQRPIVIAGLALALVLPPLLAAGMNTIGRRTDLEALASVVPAIVALLMWPLMAVACGASTISVEIGEGTLQFLLSRPASRLRVWLVKVVTAALALLIIVAGSLVIAAGFLALARGGDLSNLAYVEIGQSLELGLLSFTVASVAGGVFLLFACGVFFSTFLSRPLNAAAAGLVTALLIGALLLVIWTRLDLVPLFEPELLALELFAAGVLALVASLWVFTLGELLSGRKVLRTAVFGAAAALVALFVLSVPIVLSQMRLDPGSALLTDPRLVPDRNAVVATAFGANGTSAQVWLIHLDGSGIERLTGRLAGVAAVSPDGRHVAYVSVRGPFGLRSDTASLHVVRTDGGGDRVLVSGLGPAYPTYLLQRASGEMHFTPRGDRVAVVVGPTLVIAALDGTVSFTRSVDEDLPRHARVVGWTTDGSEVLLLSPPWYRDRGTRLVAYDPEARRVREVFASPRPQARMAPLSRDASGSSVLLLALGAPEDTPEVPRFSVVEVNAADGTATTIFDAECAGPLDLSADGETLVYGACRRIGVHDVATEIRFRDRLSGGETAGPSLPSRVESMFVSPTSGWVAIGSSGRSAALRSDGVVTEFGSAWVPMGWTGRTGVVLAEAADAFVSKIAVADATSGAIRGVYP